MGETAKLYRYEGKDATVTWNQQRCIHAGECTHGLPAVFSSKHDPWGQPDNAPLAELAATIDRCPSGALQLERPSGHERAADAINSVTLSAQGPLSIRGRVKVGDSPVEARVTLCRCGASRNKPYCDNSHASSGFAHDGRLGPAGEKSTGAAAAGADFVVMPRPNGPLHCTGSVELVGSDGVRAVVSETWLCRCGGSSRKPFCDGTHRKIGFAS
jgi:CDGSH-type Zn-finger protein/uncharacterized Fe-S cluster protein YjdI